MFWIDLTIAFLVALVLSAAFVAVLGWRRPGGEEAESAAGGALFFFFVLFLATWAGGAWLAPASGSWTAAWVPFLIVGLLVALLLAAVVPAREERWRWSPPRGRRSSAAAVSAEHDRQLARLAAGLGVFFWALLLGLALAILGAYLA